MDAQQIAKYQRLSEMDKEAWQNISEPRGVIPPEAGPSTHPFDYSTGLATEGIQQFMSVLKGFFPSLFAPTAYDNTVLENIPSIENPDGTINIQQSLANEQYNPGNIPESERLRLANELMATDELQLKRSQGFPPGPNVMTSQGKSYNDRNILNSLLEEFGAAQPVSSRQMPR